MNARNIVLSVALAAVVAAHFFVSPAPDAPNRDFLPGMVYSRAAEAFDASPLLAGGRVLQPPPAGTVARRASLVTYAATPADAVRAGTELVAPAVEPADGARGAALYGTFCSPCHGGAGVGDGTVVKRGFPAPPSLLAPSAVGMRDGQIFHIVTYGQVNMPGYAAQISEEDRWRVLAYVRQLQRSGK
jgi:mono/diheme cytochrome c family protein